MTETEGILEMSAETGKIGVLEEEAVLSIGVTEEMAAMKEMTDTSPGMIAGQET